MFSIILMDYFKSNKTLTEKELEDRFYNLY